MPPPFVMTPLLSCYQAAPLLDARARGLSTALGSLDLGRSEVPLSLDEQGVVALEGRLASWEAIERIAAVDSVCFALRAGEATPIRIFSEQSSRSFQLWPTPTSPALLISGFLMHRIRDVAPDEGAALMVRALGRIQGRVLDTTSGLGYAAIVAARVAREVVTIEIEPVVRELARQNPWSRELFDNPKIALRDGDSRELVATFEPQSFAGVVHDPPAVNVAGELYSASFYASLHRLLKRGGKLFHYIGDAQSSSGSRTTRGVVKRLRDVGFERVTAVADAFGVLAVA